MVFYFFVLVGYIGEPFSGSFLGWSIVTYCPHIRGFFFLFLRPILTGSTGSLLRSSLSLSDPRTTCMWWRFLWAIASNMSCVSTAITDDLPWFCWLKFIRPVDRIVDRLRPSITSGHKVAYFCDSRFDSSWRGVHRIWVFGPGGAARIVPRWFGELRLWLCCFE